MRVVSPEGAEKAGPEYTPNRTPIGRPVWRSADGFC